MRRVLGVWLLCCLLVASAHARPRLAEAYAQPAWLIDDGPVMDGRPRSGVSDDVVVGARRQYEAGGRMHRTGNTLVGIGAGVTVVSLVVFASTVQQRDWGPIIFSAMGVAGGTATLYTGAVLSTVGALRATSAVNRGLGAGLNYNLVIGSFVAIGSGPLLPWAGAFAAVGMSVMQMSSIREGLARVGLAGVRLTPTPNGLALSGRF